MRQCLFIILWAASFTSYAQETIILDKEGAVKEIQDTQPTRTVEEVDDGIIVTYQFSSFIKQPDPLFENQYFVKINGFGLNHSVGEPSTLQRWDSFVVPDGCKAQIELLESSYNNYNFKLSPSRPLLFKEQEGVLKKENIPNIKPYRGNYPSNILSLSNIQHYRGTTIQRVGLCPIQYDYEDQTVRVYKTLKYKMRFVSSQDRISNSSYKVNISPDDFFLKNNTLNSFMCSSLRSPTNSTSTEIPCSYLILSINDYAEPVNRLAEWKRQLGFNVHVCLRNSWNSSIEVDSIIKNYPDGNIYYLLIVGGHQDVPAQTVNNLFIFSTDFFYGCKDNDSIPDIMRGRLLATNEQEVSDIVDKIIGYEQQPYTANSSFYSKGIHCAYFQDENNDGYEDRRFVKTSEEIRDYLMTKQKDISRIYYADYNRTPLYWNNDQYFIGGSIPDSLKRPGFSWDGNGTNISSKINEGAFYVLYNGHGSSQSWTKPYYDYLHIMMLNNQNKLPVVFSMACNTGDFWSSSATCFCERFLKKPNGGCVAIFGASNNSYSGADDALIDGMFDAIWPTPGLLPTFGINHTGTNVSPTPSPTYCLGQIMDQGMAKMYETWAPDADWKRIYTRCIYHCFGDPSMQIYTDVPTAFNNVTINWKSDSITVTTGGESATIAFYNKSTQEVRRFIGTAASIMTDSPEDFSVCVSAHNKIPYIVTPNVLYIQNVTTTGTNSYNADYIKVGTAVTNEIPTGDVTLGGTQVTLRGKKVILEGTTTVPLGTVLNINP